MSVNSLNTFLNVKDAHLRVVSGNVYATAMNIGGINVDVAHGLQSVTDQGNVTSNTLQFSNATTGFVTTANITVGRDLTVTGNALVSSNLTVTGNVMVSDDLTVTENLLVSNNLTVTKNVTVTGNTFYTNPMSISVDSNVVAEYTGPHDRPLRKYPEVALTSASQDGYVVTASSQYNVDYAVYNAFNDVIQEGEAGAAGVLWTSANSTYPASGGFYVGTTYGIGTTYGEFVKLELPYKIKPKEVRIFPRKFHSGVGNAQSPAQFKIFGSNDNFSSEIVEIYHQNTDWVNNGTWGVFDISHTTHFKHFGIVFTKTNGSIIVGVQEIEYYGHEEGSGSLDTTLKSVYNVPATTGTQLEVYYDAKDLANGAVTSVTDLSPNTNGGTGTDVTVADGAFVFNGTSSLIESTTSIVNQTGDVVHAFSLWIKPSVGDLDDSGNHYLVAYGTELNTGKWSGISISNKRFASVIHASIVRFGPEVRPGEWYHIVLNYKGGGIHNSNRFDFFINGTQIDTATLSTAGSQAGSATLNLSSPAKIIMGGLFGGSERSSSIIANTRLYSKALNAGQVQELYDYQKDYFLGSKSQVTLYKGHLGVGVTEPSGQLELAGDERLQAYPPRGMTHPDGTATGLGGSSADGAMLKNITYIEGHGEFKASASLRSRQDVDYDGHQPYNAFDYNDSKSYLLYGPGSGESVGYNKTTGYFEDNNYKLSASSGTPYGHWLQLEMPYKINVKSYFIQHVANDYWPQDWQIWASNDDNNWTHIHSYTGGTYDNDPQHYTVSHTGHYKIYTMIITRIKEGSSLDRLRIQELRYFGTPGPTTLDKGSLTLGRSLDVPRISRYDVDTETPRPEKLLVDFDTTVNSSPTDISGNGNHGAFYGTAQYSAADKAFKFDGNSDYIQGTLNLNSSELDGSYTLSAWVKRSSTTNNNSFLFYIGTDGTGDSIGFYSDSVTSYKLFHYNATTAYATSQPSILNTYRHIVATYDGTYRRIYIDGVMIDVTNTGVSAPLGIPDNPTFSLGMRYTSLSNTNEYLHGYMSNPKIYSVALEGSEVQKLYRLGRTGRSMVISDTAVGIGKVPEAQLDVRGTIKGVNMTTSIAAWSVARTTNINDVAGPTTIQWTDVQYNIGGCYSSPNFTAPVSGYYYHSMHMITKNDSVATYVGYYINDIDVDTQADFGAYDDASGSNSYGHRNIAGSWIIYLNAGDRLKLVLKDGSMNSNLNRWSGFFLST